MLRVRVAGAALNQTPLDWAGNFARIERAMTDARKHGADILCLPELCLTGYGCEDAFHSASLAQTAWDQLIRLAPLTRGMIVSVGLPIRYQNALFNAACLIADGEILGFAAKRFLAGDGIHYEPRWFKPWPQGLKSEVHMGGRSYPMGDIFFDVSGIRIGFEICEDAWVARRPGGDLSLKGVDILLNPSASHFAFGKFEVRKRFVIEGSRAFGVTYVYSNLLGCESGRAIFDGGVLIASGGALVAQGPRLAFDDVVLTVADVDVDATRTSQARSASFQPNLKEAMVSCVSGSFSFPSRNTASSPEKSPLCSWENSTALKKEEFTRAVALGLYDYLRKTRSKGFVVSLSGGADSSAVSCLCALMIRLAQAELGNDALKGRLEHIERVRQADDARSKTKALLTCVYQASSLSGSVTRSAARVVAEGLGAEFFEWEIQEHVDAYVRQVSTAIGRKIGWETDDITLQNIQARVRAPGVWMLANEKGALFLTTSNRSEAAVGYATMDGDTCGGLAPLGGIDKAFLLEWLKWLEMTGPEGQGPMPFLHAVNVQAPTAELRPAASGQTDEKDLMPYAVLDEIERLSIRDKRSPVEIYDIVRSSVAGRYSDRDIALWVEKFFRLWCRNQWKRERYAPSFHLDDENLDPKTWCRFPILSGNYEKEIEDLRQYSGLTS